MPDEALLVRRTLHGRLCTHLASLEATDLEHRFHFLNEAGCIACGDYSSDPSCKPFTASGTAEHAKRVLYDVDLRQHALHGANRKVLRHHLPLRLPNGIDGHAECEGR